MASVTGTQTSVSASNQSFLGKVMNQVPNPIGSLNAARKKVNKRLDSFNGVLTDVFAKSSAFVWNNVRGRNAEPVSPETLRPGAARFAHVGTSAAHIAIGVKLTVATAVLGVPFFAQAAHSLRGAIIPTAELLLRGRFGGGDRKSDLFNQVVDVLTSELDNPAEHIRSPEQAASLLKLAIKSQDPRVISAAIKTLAAHQPDGKLNSDTLRDVTRNLASRLQRGSDYRIEKTASRLNKLLDVVAELEGAEDAGSDQVSAVSLDHANVIPHGTLHSMIGDIVGAAGREGSRKLNANVVSGVDSETSILAKRIRPSRDDSSQVHFEPVEFPAVDFPSFDHAEDSAEDSASEELKPVDHHQRAASPLTESPALEDELVVPTRMSTNPFDVDESSISTHSNASERSHHSTSSHNSHDSVGSDHSDGKASI